MKKKSEVFLYLVMSKTVLICSETSQRKKLQQRERDWKTTNITKKKKKKKKKKTFCSFYFLSSSISCRSCLSFFRSLEMKRSVNENKQLDNVTKKKNVDSHLCDIH
jgi:hypothetical protein